MLQGFGRWVGLGAIALIASLVNTSEIRAEKVGVAAAVHPDAFSSLAGAPQTQINIGKSIFYNEHINTTGSGLVQVLLIDGSTFTVGPGSDLVIDKFVYNPRKGTGEISASFSKGVMRFVGGKLSKNDGGVTVNTPAGALAIRGGIALTDFKDSKNYSVLFVFGEYLKLGNKTLFEKGYGWFMNNGQFQTRPFNASDLKNILAALTNNAGGFGGKPPDPPKPNDTAELFNTQSLNQLVVDATTEQITTQAKEAANQQTSNPQPEPEPEPDPEPCVGTDCPQPEPEPEPCIGTDCPQPEPEPCVGTGCPQPEPQPCTGTECPPLNKTETGPTGSYASGVYERGGSGEKTTGLLADVAFDPSSNTVSFGVSNGEAVIIRFDENGNPTSATVTRDGTLLAVTPSYVEQTRLMTRDDAICAGCDFLEWGTWETHMNYRGTGRNADPTNLFAQGWWVKGELTTISDLNILWEKNASATYNGTAWGDVLNQGAMYNASGDLEMNWSFGKRSGDLTISNFDTDHFEGGLTFGSGPDGMTQVPNKNEFGGNISGSGVTGSATGSFVNNGSIAAGGVTGKWGVQGTDYQASGVFGGSGTPR